MDAKRHLDLVSSVIKSSRVVIGVTLGLKTTPLRVEVSFTLVVLDKRRSRTTRAVRLISYFTSPSMESVAKKKRLFLIHFTNS